MANITNNYAEGSCIFNAGSSQNGDVYIQGGNFYQSTKHNENTKHASKQKNPQPQAQEESPYPFVVVGKDKAKRVIEKIKEYMEGKNKAKDIMRPLRAAQDAGVIRRITPQEMDETFPEYHVCKNSVNNYMNPAKKGLGHPYPNDEAFDGMVADFKKLTDENA